ncbi:MAG: hypothetical protein HW387_1285 [Parachlamydiales bacterium]|nr:hypothetical protein [Parachlamydiales bacterium]
MKTTVTTQQIGHFYQFGWIEFEGFLSVEECAAIQSAIWDTAQNRLGKDKLSRFGHERLYLAGRDCWRDSPFLRQHYLSQRFASTAASLSNKQHLLLACDQWIPEGKTLEPLRLNEHVSFQNLACGCLIFFEKEQQGKARFFLPERLPILTGSQLIIAYGSITSVFIHNPQDPNNGYLKQFGYSFGDRIRAQHHPACRI